MRLAGKVALVTGAQQGIGKAIALAYGHEGASVVLNYLDHKAAAEESAAQIRALGQHAVTIAGDVAQVQLGVMPLRLYHLGTLFKLPRFATVP